ncbi:cellulase family glycosylhydrolase [Mycolicibacterium cosmeticum]|uniref:cellulase family glycosylhydrolase n=1 Tax=Mycolicibacterium cosmeticum TaxID=258533 RepID=UPI003204E9D3
MTAALAVTLVAVVELAVVHPSVPRPVSGVVTMAQPDRSRAHIRTVSYNIALMSSIDTSSTTTGVADSQLYFMDSAALSTAISELKAMGVTQVRVFLPWAAIETADGTYNWTQADALLNALSDAGIAVDAAITSTPTWASSDTSSAYGAPTSTSDYASFVTELAERYGTTANNGDAKIAAYEIWNEPNGSTGWAPTPDAAAYTELLKAAYTAIKAVDPDATVVGGVLGAGVTSGTSTVNPVTFLEEMYAAGAEGYFDALSFHPYNYSSDFTDGASTTNSPYQELQALRALMDANGDTDKLIWATEYGIPTSLVTQSQQAAYIADFLTAWASLEGVGPTFIYSLVDLATGDGVDQDNFGLFTSDWTPKLAVEVLEDWIANQTVPDWATDTSTPTLQALLTQLVRNIVATVTAPFTQLAQGLTSITTALSTAAETIRTQLTAGVASLTTGFKTLTTTIATALKNLASSLQKAGTTSGSTTETTVTTDSTEATTLTAEATATAARTQTSLMATTSTTAATAKSTTAENKSATTDTVTAAERAGAPTAAADSDTGTATSSTSDADTTTATSAKSGAAQGTTPSADTGTGKAQATDADTAPTTANATTSANQTAGGKSTTKTDNATETGTRTAHPLRDKTSAASRQNVTADESDSTGSTSSRQRQRTNNRTAASTASTGSTDQSHFANP